MPNSKQVMKFSSEMEEYVKVDFKNSFLDAAIDFITGEFDPGDIYDEKKMIEWAEANGYILEENK